MDSVLKVIQSIGLDVGVNLGIILLGIFFMFKFSALMEKRMKDERQALKEEREREAERADIREKRYIAVLENYTNTLEHNTIQSEQFQSMTKATFDATRDDLKLISSSLNEQLESMRDLKNSFAIICTKYATLKKEHDDRIEKCPCP